VKEELKEELSLIGVFFEETTLTCLKMNSNVRKNLEEAS
jgi:hypothetical protein